MTIALEIRPHTQDDCAAALLEEAAHAASAKSRPIVAKDIVELFAPIQGLDIDFEVPPNSRDEHAATPFA